MLRETASSYFNAKAIFCLAFFASATDLVWGQTLSSSLSILDETRKTLIGYWSSSAANTTANTTNLTANTTGSPPHAPSNKFFEALYHIERALYAAQAAGTLYTHSSKRLAKIKKNIKLASKQGNQMFARQSLGDGLYSAIQLEKKKSGMKRSISSFAVKNFMDSIKKDLGGDSFKILLGVKGKVTLIFVIDNTGSMGDEIAAAKAIAKSIVNQPRKEAVNYILSPFNDPSKCLETIQLYRLK